MECLCLFISPSAVETFLTSGDHCHNTPDTQEHILLHALHALCYFIRATMLPGYTGTVMNVQIVLLNTLKSPSLKQATPKNTCQNFPTQKDPEIKNLNPKKSFDLPCHLKSGVLPPGQGLPLQP